MAACGAAGVLVQIDLAEMQRDFAGLGYMGAWAVWFWYSVKWLSRPLDPGPWAPAWRRWISGAIIYFVAIFGFQLAVALAFMRW